MKVHNKEESCEGCPDRTADPNCHDTCRGYIKRQAERNMQNKERRKDFDYYQYKDDVMKKKGKVGEK